jgi:protein O-GlcNAc transferase
VNPEIEELREAGQFIQAGRFVEAERMLVALLATRSQLADAWFLLGAARHQSGNASGALIAFAEARRLAPESIQAFSAHASVLFDLERYDEALSEFRALADGFPGDAQLHVNLGVVLERLGRLEEALKAYDQALVCVPGFAAALNNRAIVLAALGRMAEALVAYDELVAIHPASADYHFNRAELLHGLGRFEESVAATDRALRLDSRHVNAMMQKALNLAVLGRIDEARELLAQARVVDPLQFRNFRNPYDTVFGNNDQGLDPRLVYLEYLYSRQTLCDWSRHGEYLEKFAGIVAASIGKPDEIRDPRLPFRSLAFPMAEAVRTDLAVGVAQAVREHANVKENASRKAWRISGGRRLRVGYVSPDFRVHPMAYLMQPLIELHDRTRFEAYAYSLTKSDGSEIRRRVEHSVDAFRDESEASDAEIASHIAADRVDILVDLAGYTNFSREGVFARRPSPIQVSYLGFAGTLGANHIDYAIVDHEVCPPGAERHWVEKLVYLPHSYFVASHRDRADSKPSSRASTGLPAGSLVFCCFNNAHKIEPVMFSIWMRALRAIPDAVLWIYATDARIEDNLRREAASRGVDAGRLIFAPYWAHERHLGRLVHADLMVDTLYYNAHSTAVDALGAGVPVLTCRGNSMPSRVASSLLKAMGVPELVTDSPEDYERRLLFLGRNRAELERVKANVRENYDKMPLFATGKLVRALESALETMAERSRAGLPPQSFDISAID